MFWKKLFGKANVSEATSPSGDFIVLPHSWAAREVGDGTQLLVERHPDLEKIFTDPDPPIPQRLTKSNREYWKVQVWTRNGLLSLWPIYCIPILGS